MTLASRWFRKAEGKGQSLKDVAYVGGWKGTQVLQDVYQQADDETMEAVVLFENPLRAAR